MLIYRTIELVEYHTIVYSLDRDTMVFAARIPHPRPPTSPFPSPTFTMNM